MEEEQKKLPRKASRTESETEALNKGNLRLRQEAKRLKIKLINIFLSLVLKAQTNEVEYEPDLADYNLIDVEDQAEATDHR